MQTLTQENKHNKQQPTVLVVENNEDNLIYISSALTMFQCNVVATQNARNTIVLAQKNQPDLIMLDIKMPYLSGIDLISILKCDWLTRNIPVIAVTALTREKEKKLILDAGFDDYLVKPFLLEELEKIVSLHISRFCLG